MSGSSGSSAFDPAHRFGVASPGLVAVAAPPDAPPAPPRRRPRWLVVTALIAAVLLAAGLGFMGGWWTQRPSHVTVLRVVRPVPAGAAITAADLQVTTLRGSDPVGAVLAQSESRVVGRAAAGALVPGSLLVPADVSDQAGGPQPGQALVGLALRPGQLPAEGLHVGDRVRAVLVPTDAESAKALAALPPQVVVGDVPVWAVRSAGQGVTVVTLLVAQGVAARLARDSALGGITLLRVPPGAPAPAATPSAAATKPAARRPPARRPTH